MISDNYLTEAHGHILLLIIDILPVQKLLNLILFEYFTVECTALVMIFLFIILDYVATEKVIHLTVTIKSFGSSILFSLGADQYFVRDHVEQV